MEDDTWVWWMDSGEGLGIRSGKIVHYQLYVKVDGRFNCVLNFKIISEVKLMIHFYKRHLLCVLFLGLALH